MSCIHMHFFINRTNPKSVYLHVHTSAGSVHAPESIFWILVKRDYQTHSALKGFIWSLPALIRAHATSLVTPLYEVEKSPAKPARLYYQLLYFSCNSSATSVPNTIIQVRSSSAARLLHLHCSSSSIAVRNSRIICAYSRSK